MFISLQRNQSKSTVSMSCQPYSRCVSHLPLRTQSLEAESSFIARPHTRIFKKLTQPQESMVLSLTAMSAAFKLLTTAIAFLQDLRLALKQVVASIPDYCLVGLLTFGEFVGLHQLGSEMPTCVVFRGTDNLSGAEVRPPSLPPPPPPAPPPTENLSGAELNNPHPFPHRMVHHKL